jgi:phage minor structural protein
MPDYLLKEDGFYLLKEDGGKIILNGAFPPAPTGVTATKGTHTDKVVITWTKAVGATGYRVYRNGVDISGLLGDVDTYDDLTAAAPTITPGTAAASDGTYKDKVALALTGASTTNGFTYTYEVKSVNAEGENPYGDTDTGYRGVGALTKQWQRSAADSDADYTNLTGATASTYNDTTAPVDATGRYYKCVLNAAGAAQQTSTADRGYREHRLKPRNVSQLVLVTTDSKKIFIPNAWGASPVRRVNELDTLTFNIPVTSRAEPYLYYPSEVWLSKDGVVQNRYIVFDVERHLEGGSAYIAVTCKGYGYVLVKDKRILSYNKTLTDNLKVSDHMAAFLAYQETARITFGGVSSSLDKVVAVNIASVTDIWAAAKILQQTVGGYLSVEMDPTDSTVWEIWLRDDIGSNTGQELRTGKNLTSVVHKTAYADYCNRLYAVGSGVNLSGKAYTYVSAEKSADATYGYLKLLEKYGAYQGWTGAGNALPAGMTIYKPGGSWVNPTSIVSATNWVSPGNAIDNNEATEAFYLTWAPNQWCERIEVARAPTASTQIKWGHGYYINQYGNPSSYIAELDIYYGAAWHNIYYGSPGADVGWVTTSFAQQTITGVRLRFYHMTPASGSDICWVKEIYIWNTTGYADDSVNWVQGADEETLRCAIAVYDASTPYVISYTHADYLIYLDGVTGHDTLAAGWRSHIINGGGSYSATDVDALLELAITDMDGLITPRVSIDVGAIDLSAEAGREFETPALGNTVKVIAPEINVAETQRIVVITSPDLAQPYRVAFDIGNKTKDIIDEI